MKKWRTAILVGVGAAVLVAALFLLLPGEERRVSILLVTLDTTRPDHLSCYGKARSHTPRIDAVAEQGVLFTQAESSAPITMPSHASILTGLFPPDHGVRDNGFFRLDGRVTTITEQLREAGYRTAAFVSSVILDSKFGLEQGFEVYSDEFEDPLDVNNRYPVSRRAGETVPEALGWLADLGDEEPFFLWVHLYDAHAPYDPPAPFNRAYKGSAYAGEVAYADYRLGPLFEQVRKMRGEDLVIVVVGDHGEALGQHGEATHGFFVYESTINVPMVISGPGFEPGRRYEDPVRTVDIAPTLLALAGLEPRPGVRGRDLREIMRGEAGDLECYSEAWIPRGFGWSGLRGLRQGDHKTIEGSRATIVDLAADPDELDESPGPRAGRMARMLLSAKAIDQAGGPSALAELTEADINALVGLGYLNATGGAPDVGLTVAEPDRDDPRDRVEQYRGLQRVRGLAAEGELEAAAELIAKVLAEDPVNPHVRMQRATILTRLGKPEDAIVDLQFAGEHLPGDPRPLNMLGQIHRSAGRLDEAADAYRGALVRSPKHYLSRYRLGAVLIEAAELSDASEVYRGILLDRPNDPRVMNNLAYTLIRGDLDREEGFRLLAKAVETSPRDGEIRMSYGDALLNDGRPAEALPHLKVAREILGERAGLLALIEKAEAGTK